MTKRQLYLDCDGVLADFDKRAEVVLGKPARLWERERHQQIYDELMSQSTAQELGVEAQRQLWEHADRQASTDFWETLYAEPNYFLNMDPMPDAQELVDAIKHLDPIILTGCPRGYWAVPQKLEWRDRYFPDLPMICVKSVDKRVHCRPGDVLVDDWPKYKQHWEEKGGIFVLHTSAKDTLVELAKLRWL